MLVVNFCVRVQFNILVTVIGLNPIICIYRIAHMNTNEEIIADAAS